MTLNASFMPCKDEFALAPLVVYALDSDSYDSIAVIFANAEIRR